MLEAVCEDFVALGHTVVSTIDHRIDSKLQTLCDCLPIDFIQLTSDKWKCHQWFVNHGVPSPASEISSDSENGSQNLNLRFPLVAKPIDGAGSESVQLVKEVNDLTELRPGLLLQEYIEGTPVSVSVISNEYGEVHYCEPGRQVFAPANLGRQVRTEHTLRGEMRERALHLAEIATAALPRTRGYFGIDMLLGETQTHDVVIEINPRLTTSYCSLRKISNKNLACLFV